MSHYMLTLDVPRDMTAFLVIVAVYVYILYVCMYIYMCIPYLREFKVGLPSFVLRVNQPLFPPFEMNQKAGLLYIQ
jgi:hypothetical protein